MIRLPLHVSNPCSRRQCINSTISAFDDATDANGIEEKLNLEEELFRLRESTRAALQQSWDEVESLQQQCADHLHFTSQLESQLIDVNEREETWRIRCLTAETKLESYPQRRDFLHPTKFRDTMRSWTSGRSLGLDSVSSAQQSETEETKLESYPQRRDFLHPTKFRDTMRSWTSGRSLGLDSVSSTQSEPTLPGAETQTFCESAQSALGYPMIDCQNEQLSLKLSSRDVAIAGLEQTVEQHVKAMQNMQAEMLCLMETQRIKDKIVSESHRRKEERLEKVVEFHRKKLIAKEARVEEHQRKLSDYRIYIEELTGELAKVLQVVQDVDARSSSSDCDSSHSRSRIHKGKIKNPVPESIPITADLPMNEIFLSSAIM